MATSNETKETPSSTKKTATAMVVSKIEPKRRRAGVDFPSNTQTQVKATLKSGEAPVEAGRTAKGVRIVEVSPEAYDAIIADPYLNPAEND